MIGGLHEHAFDVGVEGFCVFEAVLFEWGGDLGGFLVERVGGGGEFDFHLNHFVEEARVGLILLGDLGNVD